MNYTSINILGNLISEDILQKVEQGEALGQQAKDFGFEPGTNLRSEIEYAWSRIKLDWKHFSERSQNLQAGDPYGTSLARKWMNNFLSSLNFELTAQKSSLQGGNNQSYSISHTAESLDGLPVHIVGFYDPNHPDRNTLDSRSSGGTSRLSPHGTVQEYLNVTEHLYSLVTNGLTMRLIRDSGRLVKLTYVEFDLKRMLDDDKYSEFTVLYRLIHASRFPRSKQEADQCLLEKYYQDSIETGNRIRDGLSDAVQKSLVSLGNGFLRHPDNNELRAQLQNGTLTSVNLYRQLRRLIYRLLFLMVTEERDLLYEPNERSEEILRKKRIYLDFYSIGRLRKLSGLRFLHESQFSDLWQGLVNTFLLFEAGGKGYKLGIMPLDGDLFSSQAITNIESCTISNQLLLECIRNLNEFTDKDGNLVSINYRALDVEELGSVYEGLLDLHPVIEGLPLLSGEGRGEVLGDSSLANLNFTFHEGTDRKTTGSYYTRPDLVNELIKSALIPVIEERLAEVRKKQSPSINDAEKALLSLKVCDPASGSGHMLLAAARTIAWYLARVRSGEDNPAPAIYRTCLRETIQHCVYGVDMNPDAVELCKLALWLESHNSGKPLSFLDHKIRCGNSLVGVTDLEVLKKGIPDDAFNPVTGDDKEVCKELKKINAAFNRTKQYDLFGHHVIEPKDHGFSTEYNEMEEIQQDTINAVQKARDKFVHLRSNPNWYNDWTACNLWTSAFFYTYTPENKIAAPTGERLAQFLQTPAAAYAPMVGKANAVSTVHRFFHWPLEFPDVFEKGGFDVIMGNPPWEAIQPEEMQFFKVRSPKIADLAGNKRKKAIEDLLISDYTLYNDWIEYSRAIISLSKFINESENFTLTTSGKLNTYSLFTELNTKLVREVGRVSIVVPTGIASDNSNKEFFEYILQSKRLVSLYGFENETFIFPSVHHSFKFCLLTITGKGISTLKSKVIFFCRKIEDISSTSRSFDISIEDIKLINPNTKTCPIFRTKDDFSITQKIYLSFPVINNQTESINPWNIKFKQGLYNMTSDSSFFKEVSSDQVLPLYEAKMIFHFDHRYSTYENATQANLNMGTLPNLQLEEKTDPNKRILSRYFVEKDIFKNSIIEIGENYNWYRNWFLCFRDVTSSISERTSIFSIVPKLPLGNNIPICFSNMASIDTCLLLANFNSLIFDFITRQKVAGNHLNFFIIEQLPVPIRQNFEKKLVRKITLFIIELTYSTWDIKSFTDDVWNEADAELKAAISNQWEENKASTGGHTWSPPEWCEDYSKKPEEIDGCPLPPFKWDEQRRAVLKAELDAIYAKLYGLTTEELRYVLDPQDVYGPDFPGETFRVLKEKEIRLYGEYRTRRLVLEAWERLNNQ